MIPILFSCGLFMLSLGFVVGGKEYKKSYPKMLYHIPWYICSFVLLLIALHITISEIL